jgi:hypothetical protein
MDSSLFDAIVDELGENLYFVHLYNWGEPLLHKKLPRFVRRLSEAQIAIDIHSNLSLPLREDTLAELLEAGVDRLEASIDGFSQTTYGRYRRRGDFALARDNLLRLARLRDQLGLQTQLVWNFLVFRYNENEIGEARRFCDDHGIEFQRREAAVSEAMRVEFLPSYRAGEDLDGCFEQRRKPINLAELRQRDPLATCAWHYFYSVINHDGSVSPCCAPWESDWDIGVVSAEGNRFAAVWNSPTMQAARNDVAGHRLLDELERNGQLDDIRTEGDLQRHGGLCRGCQLPAPVMELYSYHADAIVAQQRPLWAGDERRTRLLDLVRGDPQAFVQAYASAASG